jgi:hypothetical protein
LKTFHHRGANYPDALLLDSVLKEYIQIIGRHPAYFLDEEPARDADRKRIRRRALRQGMYFRRHYEGLAVPDVPTSPGESTRVLPLPHPRVPDEQILDATKRRRYLFENDLLDPHFNDAARAALRQSIVDLDHADELLELGMAIFLDRPLGTLKKPGEPDLTPLLSHTAFSRSIATRRLHEMRAFPDLAALAEPYNRLLGELERLEVCGFPVGPPVHARPDRVTVWDAWRVATDFILIRTTTRSVREFLSLFEWPTTGLAFDVDVNQSLLILPGQPASEIVIYNDSCRRRIHLQMQPDAEYSIRAGVERPKRGFHAVKTAVIIDGEWTETTVDVNVASRTTE